MADWEPLGWKAHVNSTSTSTIDQSSVFYRYPNPLGILPRDQVRNHAATEIFFHNVVEEKKRYFSLAANSISIYRYFNGEVNILCNLLSVSQWDFYLQGYLHSSTAKCIPWWHGGCKFRYSDLKSRLVTPDITNRWNLRAHTLKRMAFVPKGGHAATRISYPHIDICIVINVPPTAEKMKRTHTSIYLIALRIFVASIKSPTLFNFAQLTMCKQTQCSYESIFFYLKYLRREILFVYIQCVACTFCAF